MSCSTHDDGAEVSSVHVDAVMPFNGDVVLKRTQRPVTFFANAKFQKIFGALQRVASTIARPA